MNILQGNEHDRIDNIIRDTSQVISLCLLKSMNTELSPPKAPPIDRLSVRAARFLLEFGGAGARVGAGRRGSDNGRAWDPEPAHGPGPAPITEDSGTAELEAE
jgi:hypothetical protein